MVTNDVPFALTSLGQSYVITTSVGRSFQIYDASNLHLLFISQPQTPSRITYLHSHFHWVFASWERSFGIYKRGRCEKTITLPEEDSTPIVHITTFGDWLIVSTSEKVYVYKANPKDPRSAEIYTTLSVPKTLGPVVTAVHPPTFLNKIVIATENALLLYNVRTGKLIHTADGFSGKIAAVEAAPVLDVLGVATASGDVHIFNIRQSRTLFMLGVSEPVTSLSFRTDGVAHLAIGTMAGDLFFYDLNVRRRVHSVRGAHADVGGGVSRAQYLAGQPIVVTSGGDNLLQELVFDPALTSTASKNGMHVSTPPRMLRSRGGHAKPSTALSFVDEEAHFILSASHDQSMWLLSLRKDAQNRELSQRIASTGADGKRLNKMAGKGLNDRFPEITALAQQPSKQGRWDNVVTAHKGLNYARTWDASRGIVGTHSLRTLDGSLVKSVAISQCGNFALIGSSEGSIAVYNLQSGILRKRINSSPTTQGGHSKAVTGVACDALNRVIISTSLDGTVMWHNFHTGAHIATLDLGAAVIACKLHTRSNLLAVALDNLALVVVDIQTRKKVRELWGHSNRITAFDFTPDSRWLVSASIDSTIRTWDIPTGGCIDAVKVDNIVASLAVSPNGEWLATSHVRGVGIQLWTVKSQFQHVSTRHVGEDEIVSLELPNAAGEGGSSIIEGALEAGTAEEDEESTYISPEQLSSELVTLSLQPRAKFNTLNNLEVIRQRNKPTEAPKAPEKIPFFLQAANNANGGAKTGESETSSTNGGELVPKNASSESRFTQLLRGSDSDAFVDYLKSLSPAATDLEIRSLTTLPPYDELVAFINHLTKRLEQNRDYELIQAWIGMLLRVHGDVIHSAREGPLAGVFLAYSSVQNPASAKMEALAKYCAGVVNYIRTI